MAIPPYVSWLVELSMIWNEEKVKNFTRKLVALSGGRLRHSEEEGVVSGEVSIAPHMGGAAGQMWQGQGEGGAAGGGGGLAAGFAFPFLLWGAEDLATSHFVEAV